MKATRRGFLQVVVGIGAAVIIPSKVKAEPAAAPIVEVSVGNLADIQRYRYAEQYCTRAFKSEACGYVGEDTTCTKTYQECMSKISTIPWEERRGWKPPRFWERS